MVNRIAASEIKDLLESFPVIMFSGPRQVGKTTLAKEIASLINRPTHYLDLEKEEDLKILKTNSYAYLMALKEACVIIDEVQILPSLFSALRAIVDEHRVPGRFVLLGSANLTLVKGVSETLAGRVIYLDIHQINLLEAKDAGIDMETHWFKGGFPEQLLSKNDKVWRYWTDNFIKSYIYRDINFLFGIDLSPIIIDRLWHVLASQNSGIENIDNIARTVGVSSSTTKKYLEFLEGAFLIHRLPAFYVNNGKRLVKANKLYLRTSGVLHYMLKVKNYTDLQTNMALGASWEGYVIEQIFSMLPPQTRLLYYRTHNGAEMDLVLANGIAVLATIEIKYSNAPELTRGYYESISDLNAPKNFVITPNSVTWQIKDGITVCSLEYFLRNELNEI